MLRKKIEFIILIMNHVSYTHGEVGIRPALTILICWNQLNS